MTCSNYRDLLMGYLDNELSQEQRREFEQHLSGCRECSDELKEFRRLKAITDEVTLVEPEDRVWQQYWNSVYNRIERGLGWIILSISSIILVIFGGFKIIEDIIKDPNIEMILKVGLLALIAGLAILFVSVLRERIFFWQKDRYRDVRR